MNEEESTSETNSIIKEFNKYLYELYKTNNGKNTEETMKITSSFHCIVQPDFAIESYIKNIIKKLELDKDEYSDDLYVFTMHIIIYLNRIIDNGYKLNNYNLHRLIATIMLISHKIINDKPYDNETWCNFCGVKDINLMEIQILEYLDFRLFISIDDLDEVFKKIREIYNNNKIIK